MLAQFKKSALAQQLKKNPIAQKFRNFFVIRFLERYEGDWRYPFMMVSWWVAGVLVPRRKISLDNISFSLSCTNWITHFRWYLFKSKEPEVRSYINDYVKENDIFFDIGTNVGVFSVYAAKRHPGISVFCFEPEYSNLNKLKENLYYNALLERVKVYAVGISDFVGFSELHIQDFTAGSAAHTESNKAIGITDEGYSVCWSEGIMAVTLDYICEQLGIIPNVMKIDTDGNEDKVLRGAMNTISNTKLRSLMIEMPIDNKKREYCHERLESAGFHLEWSDSEKTINEIWVRR